MVSEIGGYGLETYIMDGRKNLLIAILAVIMALNGKLLMQKLDLITEEEV